MTTTTRDRAKSRPRTIRWGDLLVAAIGLGIAAVLFAGVATMEVRGQSVPGPQFFPLIVAILLAAVSGFLLLRAAIPAKRVEEHDDIRPDISREMLIDVSHTSTQLIDLERDHQRESEADAAGSAAGDDSPGDLDWRALLIAAASMAGFIVLLPVLGWIISCTLLFAGVTLAFGSKRIWFNLAIGLFIGALVQLVFSGLLGLALPAGFIGGI
ncbi:tripartite tricarboxylate transporter TctB family protein [Leucobacter tenebrionis]|uniref:tripartite tricarboxylate transporter TctB family protein n=1 Tax=Leucobacter tenebrionis TaxID=2873270 RepID=UPI001CA6BD59|nr:tripartite tricarboxylate transporter TctB family protein [Leucobacter tenebrionis]QZY51147.1 tripartite tricarboxylate transporter TctB family protein [Leucobacter tenebrionis]